MTLTPSPFIVRHSESLDRSDFSTVWSCLADIWDWVTANREYPNAIWRFWQKWLSAFSVWFEQHKHDFTLLSGPYRGDTNEPFPRLVVLSEDTRVSNDPSDPAYHSYYVDPDIRRIDQLDDSLAKVDSMLLRGPAPDGQFSFTTGIHDNEYGTISFHDASYWDPDMISYEDGKACIVLWATQWRAKYSDTMVDRFGEFVDYGPARKKESRTYWDLLTLWACQLLGPILPSLASGIYIHNDWPIAPASGIVQAMDSSSLTLRIPGGTIIVQNDTGLPWKTLGETGWQDIAIGDEIVVGELLVQACDIIDRVTDPWLWARYPIGYPATHHTFVCAFNGDLPLDTSSGEFAIDWDRVVAFINRNKPMGDKAYYVVRLDAIVDIVYNETTLRSLRSPVISQNFGGVLDPRGGFGVTYMGYGLAQLPAPVVGDLRISNATLSVAPSIATCWTTSFVLNIAPGVSDFSGPYSLGGKLPEPKRCYTDLGFEI